MTKNTLLSRSQQSECRIGQTTCPYCGVGCGVDVEVRQDYDSQISHMQVNATPEHPANYGRLCVKGSKLAETNGLEGRLLSPEVNGEQVSWKTAINSVASGFTDVIREHGKDAVAFYVSGQILTEDYYVANKLMKGYIGSANIDTNSRLCMSSAVAGYKRAFGADAVPCCYEDLEQTELLVFIGSNAAWTHPVLYQRIERAKKLNPAMKVVVVDPRKTATCELADLHLALKPGSDVALFNGLFRFIATHEEYIDRQFVTQHTNHFGECLTASSKWHLKKVADYCELDTDELTTFYQWFAEKPSAISFYSMGVNQSTTGVDKSNAIINCHLATGKIGKPGSGPFSMTGQPNAMGGREVGGLANMLAAHMDITNATHRETVQIFWNSPTMAEKPGLMALDLVDAMESGKVKAIWVMATNPVVSLPDRKRVERAFKRCDLVVVSDCAASNDTLDFAHIKLPATGWSEKDGMVTNSERRISRQRGIMPPSGAAKHDWRILCDVAKAMGFSGFDFDSPKDIFNEHVALSAYRNNGKRDFDLSGLGELSQEEYDSFKPIQWPVTKTHPQGTRRLFTDGAFYTKDKKANFIAVNPQQPTQQVNDSFPFVLNSGRIRDQWHTMTRTGKSPSLTQHTAIPFIAIHPKDAEALTVGDKEILAVRSSVSGDKPVYLEVKVDKGVRRGECFAPIHWSHQNTSSGSIAPLFEAVADSISGQPELKHAAISLAKVAFPQYLHIKSRHSLSHELIDKAADYWVKQDLDNGVYYQLGITEKRQDWLSWLQDVFTVKGQWLSFNEADEQSVLLTKNDLLQVFVKVSNSHVDAGNSMSTISLEDIELSFSDKSNLLRGTYSSQSKSDIVCSCFNVAKTDICRAIESGSNSVEALGKILKCGTNCGSCKPELSSLIKDASHQESIPLEVLI
ncbi:nitrate reductase [Alteromonadaceae bacterium M269]|nr:nitrate reductase [Alteromonadaceae bacterium M269]